MSYPPGSGFKRFHGRIDCGGCTPPFCPTPPPPDPPEKCVEFCGDSGAGTGNCGPGWDKGPGECPVAPLNVEVVSPLFLGALDVRWDPPHVIAKNSKFQIVGVNIYRSDSSERGPYFRINEAPVGGTFYRDFTDNVLIQDEIVSWDESWLNRGDKANNKTWRFRVRHFPMVKQSGQAIAANSPSDVRVSVNGSIVPVHEVFGPTGEVTLINVSRYDINRERILDPILPTGPETEVKISYYFNKNTIKTSLDKKIFYRVTTVALHDGEFLETPLEYAEPQTFRAVERLDYIWREAIRRNNWILEQGGERVKVFIRKTSGVPCYCGKDPRTREYDQQPDPRCTHCYGTGFFGGYEGPYDMIVAPDDADRAVRQSPTGRHLEHQYEVWTGPNPLLTQRDFVVKQTNERYSIGPVRKPSNRGNILQQFFQIKYLDENDIRYQVPLFDTAALSWPETRCRPAPLQGGAWATESPPLGPYPVGADYQQTPMQTEKDNIPDSREQRGRTAVYENLTY